MKVRILGSVKHNGQLLEQYEVYELGSGIAQSLIDTGVAEKVEDEKKTATPEPAPKPRAPKGKDEPYVAEAELSPEKKAKLEAEGKLNDDTPVVPRTHEPDPKEVTKVESEVKTEEKPQEQQQEAQEQPAVASVEPQKEYGKDEE